MGIYVWEITVHTGFSAICGFRDPLEVLECLPDVGKASVYIETIGFSSLRNSLLWYLKTQECVDIFGYDLFSKECFSWEGPFVTMFHLGDEWLSFFCVIWVLYEACVIPVLLQTWVLRSYSLSEAFLYVRAWLVCCVLQPPTLALIAVISFCKCLLACLFPSLQGRFLTIMGIVLFIVVNVVNMLLLELNTKTKDVFDL